MSVIAVIAITGAIVLNSAAIIALAIDAGKQKKETKDMKSEVEIRQNKIEWLRQSDRRQDEWIENLQEDVKQLCIEMTRIKRKPITKKYTMTRTFLKQNCKEFREEEMIDYTAELALKIIASELPEGERTLEMIDGVIIPQIRKKLKESSIEL